MIIKALGLATIMSFASETFALDFQVLGNSQDGSIQSIAMERGQDKQPISLHGHHPAFGYSFYIKLDQTAPIGRPGILKSEPNTPVKLVYISVVTDENYRACRYLFDRLVLDTVDNGRTWRIVNFECVQPRWEVAP